MAGRPIPAPTEQTQPFWEAAKEHRLAIQRCTACGRYFHPPVVQCQSCLSVDLSLVDVSGRGTVTACTVIPDSRVQGLEGQTIGIVGVELEEQKDLIVIGNVVDIRPDHIEVGLPVEVTFEEIGDGFVLPQWKTVGKA